MPISKKKKEKIGTIGFHGGVGSVTGANFVLRVENDISIMVDCGMVQGTPEAFLENINEFDYDPAEIDVVIITHAHMDHIGRLPRLVAKGFKGKVYSTHSTKELAGIMYKDAIGIMRQNLDRLEIPEMLYQEDDVATLMTLWKTEDYHHTLPLSKRVSVTMRDAGHILGSAMVEVVIDESTNVLFTGDLGNSPAPLLRDTEVIDGVHYLVMESVYGDRNHEQRKFRSEKLEKVIEDTINRGGTLMIPAFSIERTQELLYELNYLVEEGRIPRVPMFLDSPLAIKVTEVYRRGTNYFNKETRDKIRSGDDVFDFPGLTFTSSVQDSKAINDVDGAKIIIAGSGMSNGGRIIHHEKRYLGDARNTLLFIGYQASGTLGRVIQDGARKVRIHGADVPVKADIVTVSGYSGHKQRDDLIDFVADTKEVLDTVWCVMGETSSSAFLAQRLRDYIGAHAIVPSRGDVIDIYGQGVADKKE